MIWDPRQHESLLWSGPYAIAYKNLLPNFINTYACDHFCFQSGFARSNSANVALKSRRGSTVESFSLSIVHHHLLSHLSSVSQYLVAFRGCRFWRRRWR
mmetsp:Transcript_18511/g.43722  ORF Transcript_18511/g.43722 Transcript_18511/m.43722 type:complete len:99 (+) Transcript_18511:261-557(+)